MGTLTFPFTLTAGQPENVNHLNSNLSAVQAVINGGIDATNITNGSVGAAELASSAVTNDKLDPTTVAVPAGLSQTGTVRRGKSIIATEQSRTNTAYGTLTTPDEVSSVVVPDGGWLIVAFRALWKESVANAARAAIFIGSNQVQLTAHDVNAGTIGVQAAKTPGGSVASLYQILVSAPVGLLSSGVQTTAVPSDVATGQVLGHDGVLHQMGWEHVTTAKSSGSATGFSPLCAIHNLAAGTYTVSVQFKASSGSVTVKERKLWCWAVGF